MAIYAGCRYVQSSYRGLAIQIDPTGQRKQLTLNLYFVSVPPQCLFKDTFSSVSTIRTDPGLGSAMSCSPTSSFSQAR